MSLDVTLKGRDKNRTMYNIYELKWFGIKYFDSGYNSMDEFVERLNIDIPNWRDIANADNPDYDPYPEILYDDNITHNLNKMADAAGIYKYLWKPEELGIEFAKDLIKPLTKGLKDLKSNPEKYKKYNSPNGWGLKTVL